MILDGYWKNELQGIIRKLKFWVLIAQKGNRYAKHQINKYVLLSAVFIRKLVEDEKIAKKEIENTEVIKLEFALINYKISVIEYEFVGDKNFILLHVITDYYKGKSEYKKVDANLICNSIIHSYIWDLVFIKNTKDMGFCVASDRFKEKILYMVRLSNWIKYIEFCIRKGSFS